MNRLATCVLTMLAAVAALTVLPGAAQAEWSLAPGDTIMIDGDGECSVGYFASDSDGYYIVTAGHCADHTNVEVTASGVVIGKVVAGFQECQAAGGKCARGKYGITIIALYEDTRPTLKHWWTSVGDARVDDEVCISGSGDRRTRCGIVDTATSTLTNITGAQSIPGDSGSGAWGGPDHKLVGLVIASDVNETQIQPISDAQAKARKLGYDLSILTA